jgi:hypothetical protein
MKIRDEISAMHPAQRRQFLKLMGAALAVPAMPAALRYAFNELAGGVKHADAATASEGTIFLEFNYRDQVDLMHVFVPPGIAQYGSLKRGVNGEQASLFHEAHQVADHEPLPDARLGGAFAARRQHCHRRHRRSDHR